MPRPIAPRIAHPLHHFAPLVRLRASVRRPVWVKRSTAGYVAVRRRRGRTRFNRGLELRRLAARRRFFHQARALGFEYISRGRWYDPAADCTYGCVLDWEA